MIVSCKDISLRSWGKILTSNKFCPLKNLIISGNTKLPRTTGIFNMSSAHDCSSRKLGLCKACQQGANCYALRAETEMRKAVLPFRRRQEKFWKSVSAKDFVSQFVLINSMREKPFSKIRVNESGDFHTQKCVDKLEEIAMRLRRFGVRVYCYTSRNDLDFSKVRHTIITGSNFKKAGISNTFRIVRDTKKERQKGESVCKGDCRGCNLCTMHNMKIIVKRH